MTSARSHMGITGERMAELRERHARTDVETLPDTDIADIVRFCADVFSRNTLQHAALNEAAERLSQSGE